MAKKYLVTLTDSELDRLHDLLRKGKAPSRKLTRARILLLAHQGGTDEQIAHALQVGAATVGRIRKRFVEESSQAALHERPRPGGRRKLDGKQEAMIIATACTKPPEGRAKWTLQLLAERVVELKIVDAVSDGTIRRVLKKTSRSPGSGSDGASPTSAPSSSVEWRMSSTCTRGRTTRIGPRSASTNRRTR